MADPNSMQWTFLHHMALSWVDLKRLLMAFAMGSAVGLEREWRHKDSGLRTNILICMGSALFTLMSINLAGESTPNKGQVAANIVQGIGFLGAGLILHGKNRVIGLTSAATVFVVAAIGMTCGDGLYLEAFAATLLLLVGLQVIGLAEYKIGWHRYPMLYEVRADVGATLPPEVVGAERSVALLEAAELAKRRMLSAVLKVLDEAGLRLHVEDRDNSSGMERLTFSVVTTRYVHASLLKKLRESDATDQVVVFRDREDE